MYRCHSHVYPTSSMPEKRDQDPSAACQHKILTKNHHKQNKQHIKYTHTQNTHFSAKCAVRCTIAHKMSSHIDRSRCVAALCYTKVEKRCRLKQRTQRVQRPHSNSGTGCRRRMSLHPLRLLYRMQGRTNTISDFCTQGSFYAACLWWRSLEAPVLLECVGEVVGQRG